jgi:hypothetical protein
LYVPLLLLFIIINFFLSLFFFKSLVSFFFTTDDLVDGEVINQLFSLACKYRPSSTASLSLRALEQKAQSINTVGALNRGSVSGKITTAHVPKVSVVLDKLLQKKKV